MIYSSCDLLGFTAIRMKISKNEQVLRIWNYLLIIYIYFAVQFFSNLYVMLIFMENN